MGGGEIVRVEGLRKTYKGGVEAVRGIDFSVMRGETFGFLGPNGAGKSTTISMITTLLKPTSGRIEVDGHDGVRDQADVRRAIGLVPQDLTADDQLSGRENMWLHAMLYNIPRDTAEERIDELLDLVGLTDAADRRVDTYSGGMRKRLEIAEGLIHRPRVLFLDEPTLGLDIQTRKVIWEYISELKREHDMTVFITTHYLEEADSLCDRIAIMDRGTITAIGTPSELKAAVGTECLDVSFSDPPDISEMLSLDWVSGAVASGNEVHLTTSDRRMAMREVLRAAREMGWDITGISSREPDLNDAFLLFTGTSMRDGVVDSEEGRRARIQMRRARR